MAISIRHLTGTKEPLDITIITHLSVNWSAANTSSVTPSFEPLSRIPSMSVEDDNQTNPNTCRTSVIQIYRTPQDDNEPLGDDSHMWITEVQIDLWAESIVILQQFEDEINRILWTIRPNESTRLKKSNGVASPLALHTTENCEIESFTKTEVNFEFLGNDGDESGQKVGSQATLSCEWFKLKT